jgi:hypothetical protein
MGLPVSKNSRFKLQLKTKNKKNLKNKKLAAD